MFIAWRPSLILIALLATLAACESRPWDEEARRVAALAELGPGAAVADVGAGDGGLALALAERLGPDARVLATEIDAEKLDGIRKAAAEQRIRHLSAIQGGEDDARLPAGCCDAIVLRAVYHHLAQPGPIAASLRGALKPGGRLVVIDFPPNRILAFIAGAAGERGSHGLAAETVATELVRAGFERVRIVPDWDSRQYAVLVRKPT